MSLVDSRLVSVVNAAMLTMSNMILSASGAHAPLSHSASSPAPVTAASVLTALPRPAERLITTRSIPQSSVGETILLSEFPEFEIQTGLHAQHVMVSVAYQPVFDLNTHQISSAECLFRIQHAITGAIDTATFINAIEKTDFIYDLGRWMTLQCLAAAHQWHMRDLPRIAFSVNASSRELVRPNFAADLIAQVECAHLPPDYIKLELTETSLIADFDSCCHSLAALREAGIRVALDDFGAGYASLSYLRQLPIHVIKIDRSFSERLHQSKVDQIIMRHLIALAHDLGVKVVAEGIETHAQLAALKQFGCDEGQGYFLGHPMPFQELIQCARKIGQRA